MVDIQSAAAEIRRGKKEERKKQDENIVVCLLHRATIKIADNDLQIFLNTMITIIMTQQILHHDHNNNYA